MSLSNGNGAAGTFYFDLDFKNEGSVACSLFGYPGVSYVAGSQGTQVGAPAARVPAISGAKGPAAVPLAPGATVKAVLGEVDVDNFPAARCKPTPVLGLRVYPPNAMGAAFVAQKTTGCALSTAGQLEIGFVVP